MKRLCLKNCLVTLGFLFGSSLFLNLSADICQNAFIRMNLFSRLANVQESLSEADFKEIRNLLESGSFEMRAQIIDLLSKRKVSHETRLLGELLKKEKDAKIRLLAAKAIAEQPHFFVEDFENALDDPDAAIRNLAREAVKKKTAKALMASTNFLAIKSPTDWYDVEKENLLENVFSEAELALFEGSVSKMIMELVPAPEGGWKPWLFYEGVPDGFWDIEENQKAYMKWLGEKFGYTKPEHWYYHEGFAILRGNSGTRLLQKYNNSPAEMVMALVEAPEGGWAPWQFSQVPDGFWDIEENQKKYMKWLGEKLGFSKSEDWYQLTTKMIAENSGSGLLTSKFDGSPAQMIDALVEAPEGGWAPWLFKKLPKGFWDIAENQKAYVKWLGEKLKFTKPDDWYQLTQNAIQENSGTGLLQQKFRGSPSEMVKALVEAPEGGWLPWLLRGVPSGFWDDEANQKAYMKWLGEKLGYTEAEHWYLLTQNVIQENSGNGLLQQKFRGSPSEMVKALVEAPEGGWKKENFFADLSKMEGRMRDILGRWFNELEKPSFNDRKTHGLKFKESGRGIEADVLFEELKFAIEYHGHQHFQAIESFGGQGFLERAQKRDQETQEAFKNAGYIYIEIPHFKWAGGSEAALKNLILEQLQEYEASSDAEVKSRAARIREILSR